MGMIRKLMNSFKTKIFLLTSMAIIVPLVTASVLMYNRSVYAVKNQAAEIAESSIGYEKQIANNIFQLMEYWGTRFSEDEELQGICEDEADWDYQKQAEKYRKSISIFSKSKSSLTSINLGTENVSFSLYLIKQQMVFDSDTTFYKVENEENITFLQHDREDMNRWGVCEKINSFNVAGKDEGSQKTEYVISKCFEIYDAEQNRVGVLAVNVSSNLFENYYNEIQKGLSGYTLIVDTFQQPMIFSDEKLVEQFSANTLFGTASDDWREIVLGGENYLLISEDLESIDAVIYIFIETGSVLKNIKFLQRIFLIIIAITVGAAFFITNFLKKYFYQPLGVLKKNMCLVKQGNLNIKITQIRKDDLQDIFDAFNDMTDQLENLVQETANSKILYEDAELRLLQAQINPHFLYNTLDSIYSIARINKVSQIADMTMALSRFFRVSLSNGRNIVTMKEALDIAESYLIIQNIRFADKIKYEIYLEEGLKNIRVPKLLFQPLVENAVYHGLESMDRDGWIHINIEERSDYIRLMVSDNGIGIQTDELEAIRAKLKEPKSGEEYYAMRNLAMQLKLLYKGEATIEIESKYGEGTDILICIPLNIELQE